MATVNEIVRLVIDGVNYVLYDGRLMPAVMGGAPLTIEELDERQEEIRSRVKELDQEFAGKVLPEAERSEWNDLNEELESNVKVIAELRSRHDRITEIAGDPTRQEAGAHFQTGRPGVVRDADIWDLTTVRANMSDPEDGVSELRDRAMRAVDGAVFPHERADQARCKGQLERLLNMSDSENGAVARHFLLTGSPAYQRAFGKALVGRPLSERETRALSLTAADGGYAVPFTLDPTVVATSDGAVNPYRRISRVEQIVGNTWKGVTSAGVSVSRQTEGTEATDDSPTLGQPEVTVQRVQAFVPFSVEVDADWPRMQAELSIMLQQGKDVEEATSFTNGNGTPPNAQGILDGATTTFDTASSGTFAADVDLDGVADNLGARFRARAQWLANRKFYSLVRQQQTVDSGLWVPSLQLGTDTNVVGNTGYNLVGYPANDVSQDLYTSPVSAGDKLAVIGDWNLFLIVDRIGMSVELVPHLFGTVRNFPTGQRGLLAIWRNNSVVLDPAGFRTLRVKA